jgi:hypothetical protein
MIIPFMKMNMLKMNVKINWKISPCIFKDAINSEEMVRMLRMFRYSSRMLTFATRMFYSKSEDKKTNRKVISLICRRFLGNELLFLELLSRKPCTPTRCF